MKKGSYISVDGMDGSGKSTLVDYLVNALQEYDVVKFGSLTTNPVSKSIRDIVCNVDTNIHPEAETLLLCAAHVENYHNSILPLINSGKNVIADRSILSTYAYQGHARYMRHQEEYNLDVLHSISDKFYPEVIIVITGDPTDCLNRCAKRSKLDRFESNDFAYHVAVNDYFKALGNGSGCIHIENTGSLDKFLEDCSNCAAKLKQLTTNKG